MLNNINSHSCYFFSKRRARCTEDINEKTVFLHDIFFNRKDKALYESRFSGLVMKHRILFMDILVKVARLVVPDIQKVEKYRLDQNSIAFSFHKHLSKKKDMVAIFGDSIHDDDFYHRLLLQMTNPCEKNFYYINLSYG